MFLGSVTHMWAFCDCRVMRCMESYKERPLKLVPNHPPHSLLVLTMHPTAKSFYLPDLLVLSKPFRGSTNPHYRKAAAESRAWINSYNVFTDRKRAFFVQGCNELLVSHTYPHAGYEEFRTICDFVNLLFVVDEVSDDQNGADARKTGEVYLNAMRYPGWTDGSPLAKMTGEYALMFLVALGRS